MGWDGRIRLKVGGGGGWREEGNKEGNMGRDDQHYGPLEGFI